MFNKFKVSVLNAKERFKGVFETLIASVLLATQIVPMPAMATSSYLTPINNLKTVLISIVAAAGVIVLIYGVVKFATSFQKMDQNGEHQAIYTIIAGGVMVGASAVLSALGV